MASSVLASESKNLTVITLRLTDKPRKHTGERPFSCHCGKQFSRLDNLRQHAQTVHSDKHAENEIMMRELTSLHTQLAAKTSKVNRDVYSTNSPGSKARQGSDAAASGSSSAGARAGGQGYDAAGAPPPGSPYGPPSVGPPGLAYHQMSGYQHPPHAGYMLPPGQYEGYHPNYYPANPGQGQPYPAYPPSFGPPPGAVYQGGNMAYPPYAQAQYPPSPSKRAAEKQHRRMKLSQGC